MLVLPEVEQAPLFAIQKVTDFEKMDGNVIAWGLTGDLRDAVTARFFNFGAILRVQEKGVHYDTPPSGRWSLVKKKTLASKMLTIRT